MLLAPPTPGRFMELLGNLFDLFLHLDVYLAKAAAAYGPWIYAILFAVLFAETGLVFTPFLPGDSLLLTAGVLAGAGTLDIRILLAIALTAPIIGDSTNYLVGHVFGDRICASGRFIKREYVERTQAFFGKHGGKTITIARFFPIVRTFAPFLAGVGRMNYPRFLAFSAGGTVLWVTMFLLGGYFFGRIPAVAENLEYAVMFVLALSLIPATVHWVQRRRAAREHPVEDTPAACELPDSL
jgi:membrane-associated protein